MIGTYRKYSKAVGRFNTELAVQKVIFKNECVLLLSQVVEDGRVLHEMFKEPAYILRASLRKDEDLDWKLSQRLNERANDSYRQILAILGLIVQSLDQIHEETKIHRDGLGDDLSKPDKESLQFKEWAHNVRRKFRFIFAKSSLETKISDLSRCNENFRALSHQVSQFKGFRPKVDQPPSKDEAIERSLEDLQKTRKAADSLYIALTKLWSCTDHSEHSANLRLSPELGGRHLPISEVHFSIAVTSWAVERYDEKEQPVLLHIETPMEILPINDRHEHSVLQDTMQKEYIEMQLVHSLLTTLGNVNANDDTKKSASANSRPGSPSHTTLGTPAPPKKKGVTFEGDLMRVNDPPQPKNLPLINLCSGDSLCSRFHMLPSLNGGACMGYLPGQGTSRHLVYRNQPQKNDFAGAETLALLLSQRQSNQRLNKLEKWRLAGALSMAVLQYYSTPWLQASFVSNDILFFNFKHEGRPTRSLDSPHLHILRSRKGKEQECRRTTTDPWVKNETLFRLGMILLELEFEDSLEKIIEKFKIHGFTQDGPETSLSQQLLLPKHRAGEEMGTDYGRMVRMCLDCDFGLGLHLYSLDDKQLQRAFYLQIVCQFHDLLPSWEKIYGLQVDGM